MDSGASGTPWEHSWSWTEADECAQEVSPLPPLSDYQHQVRSSLTRQRKPKRRWPKVPAAWKPATPSVQQHKAEAAAGDPLISLLPEAASSSTRPATDAESALPTPWLTLTSRSTGFKYLLNQDTGLSFGGGSILVGLDWRESIRALTLLMNGKGVLNTPRPSVRRLRRPTEARRIAIKALSAWAMMAKCKRPGR
jgi:hypothetical protein